MKMNHIFMISILGGACVSVTAILVAGDDGGASSGSPHHRVGLAISLGALFRYSSHTSLNEQQASTHSMGESSSGSLGSSSSSGITSPKMSKFKRLSSIVSRRSSSSSSITSPVLGSHEVSGAFLLEDAQKKLEEKLDEVKTILIPGLLKAAPEIFQEGAGYFSSNTNTAAHNEVADILSTLDNLREIFLTCLSRGGENFVQEYETALEDNFANVGSFSPKGVYTYLGYTVKEGAAQSCEHFKQLVDKRIAKASHENTKKLLRQMRYPFGNSETKKNFDAYMKDDGSIAALKINAVGIAHYQYLADWTINYRGDIDELYRICKNKSASHPVNMSSSSDLADHAFSLELESKT